MSKEIITELYKEHIKIIKKIITQLKRLKNYGKECDCDECDDSIEFEDMDFCINCGGYVPCDELL